MGIFQNYIFDLDGTLVNSSEEVLNCFKKAFKLANIKIIDENFTSDVIGPPIKDIIKLLSPDISEDKTVNVISEFRKIYDYEENDISIMYNGMYEFLEELKAKNNMLFIATFKPTIPTMRLVDKFKLKDIFSDIYTIDKFGTKVTKEYMISNIISSYNLNKSQTVMVGDAVSDITAAHNAGIKGIGVLWGYGRNKEPLISTADYIVQNTEELRKCLKLNCLTI